MNTFRYPNGRIIPINGSNFSRLLLILINFLLKQYKIILTKSYTTLVAH